ncbi:MAG: hypothetical protein FJ088_04340 [Deltaproteobacteria bacterium]|nr:hypothetical protein [Deltaproteobacteria bacterium]
MALKLRNHQKMYEEFFCKNQKCDMPVLRCVDTFVDANAFNRKESKCFKCLQGQRIRSLFSKS